MYKSTSVPISKSGDVWSLGEHTFYCNDMLHVTGIKADLVYTDPPWNESILQKFYKWAHIVNPPTFEEFLNTRILHLWNLCPTGLIFIEFGRTTFPLVIEAFGRFRGKLLAQADCTYSTKKIMMRVGCFSFHKNPPDVYIPDELHEWNICNTLLELYSTPGQRMLEPFCGEGYHARIGMQHGLTITGIELIPQKFDSLMRKTKGEWKCLNRETNQ